MADDTQTTAAVRTDAGVEIAPVSLQAPAEGDAVVRTLLLGVGPADARAAGEGSEFRGVLGHQFVGVVESVAGDDRRGLTGRRVVGDVNIAPTDAPLARSGLGHHAPERTVLGLKGRDGCFVGRFVVPARTLSAVPESVPDEAAIFAEPLAAAIHTASLVRLESRAFVTIVGDSLIALLCAQVMARLNATVRLIGERRDRFDLCDKWGVKCRPIGEVGLRADQDVAIECTGTADGVRTALGLVRPRGSVILRAGSLAVPGAEPDGGHTLDAGVVALNELEVIGARCGKVGEAVDALESGYRGEPIRTEGLASRSRAFEAVADALSVAGSGEELKPLLLPPA